MIMGMTNHITVPELKVVKFVPKKSITIRLDADIVKYYRATGDGWQTRVNEDLKFIVQARKAQILKPLKRATQKTRGAK